MFFDAAQIGYTCCKYFSVAIIPWIWTVWVTAYVCTKERYRPQRDSNPIHPCPELANEPTWRHNISTIFIVNINQSPILYRVCRSLIKWIFGNIYRLMPSKLMRRLTNLQRWFTVGPALQTVNQRWATSHVRWDRAHAPSPNRRFFIFI